MHCALDSGVSLFDTADVYAGGESERILGGALKGRRDRCVIATKFRHADPQPGGSRKSMRVALEASLRRLGIEYVDLLQVHAPDPATPIAETIHGLQDLVAHGRILAFGLCNVAPWQLADAQHLARTRPGGAPVATVQAPVNLLQTEHLAALQPVVRHFDVGLLAMTPLGRGLLGGRYSRSSPPPEGHPLTGGKGVELWSDRGIRAAERLNQVAARLGMAPAQVAVATLLRQEAIAGVLVGATSTEQLRELVEADPSALPESEARALIRRPPVAGSRASPPPREDA